MMSPHISVRQMTLEDLEIAMQLKDAEGWNQTREDWEMLLSSNPGQCLAAVVGGEVKATVTAITYEKHLAWIGMMLVDKSMRGRGLGKLLMKSIIKKLSFCTNIKLDATPAGLPMYLKLGFIPENTIYRMTGSIEKNEKIEHSNPNIYAIKSGNLQKILDYDRSLFGVNREALLMDFIERSPQNCYYYENKTGLQGFILGRLGTRYFQLGPLSAESTEVAKDLLICSFRQIKQKAAVIDIFQGQAELVSWLQGQGFTIQRELTRMSYGQPSISEKMQQQFLISGPELG